jgi:hypothetical protein
MNNVGVSLSNGTAFWDATDKQTVGADGVYSFQYHPYGG